MSNKFSIYAIISTIISSSCSQNQSGRSDGSNNSQDETKSIYSSIHYSNGNSVFKNQWPSMLDDNKLMNLCNSGQSYYNDKCWDNLIIDLDNIDIKVSNLNGQNQNIMSNYKLDDSLYQAAQSKFPGDASVRNCLRVTTDFVPDNMRSMRDSNLGKSESCWYLTTYNMPWPFSPVFQTLAGSNTIYYIDFQTFVRYGDIVNTNYSNTWYGNVQNDIYTHNWWLNGTLYLFGKKFNLSTTNIKEIEDQTGKSINSKSISIERDGYVLSVTFDLNYNSPYSSITSSFEKFDQSLKSSMRPVIISIYKK